MTQRFTVKGVVRLCPVLEVAPWNFSALPTPTEVGARLHPQVWGAYFARAMADAGFEGVSPIRPESHFVLARSLLGTPLLDRLVDRELAEPEQSKLSGGFALFADGTALLEPACCGDLSDVDSWDQAIAERPPAGTLWIGHPALAVSFGDDSVTLAEQWEYPPDPDYLVEVTLRIDALVAAVAGARAELQAFTVQLEAQLAMKMGDRRAAREAVQALVGTVR